MRILSFTKRFGGTVAVDRLTLDIYAGEIFGILGPNGSGKTTTLLTIATVYKPTEGDILVFGHSVTREDYIVRRHVGIAFQDPKALWVDKPYDLLYWHARIVGYGGEDARRVVRETMELLGIWEHRNKYFHQLSGGTRKKVELAKVLIQRPRLAILDEPTAQVDVLAKHSLWDVIKELKREGTTVLLATNDMFEAERVCDRLAILHKGRLRALGTVSELKDMIPRGDVIEVEADSRSIPPGIMEGLSSLGRVEAVNGTVKLYVERAEEKVVKVIDIFREHGIAVTRVMVKEPTLDDVFTYLTGERLKGE